MFSIYIAWCSHTSLRVYYACMTRSLCSSVIVIVSSLYCHCDGELHVSHLFVISLHSTVAVSRVFTDVISLFNV